jgi:hypothetical protein
VVVDESGKIRKTILAEISNIKNSTFHDLWVFKDYFVVETHNLGQQHLDFYVMPKLIGLQAYLTKNFVDLSA